MKKIIIFCALAVIFSSLMAAAVNAQQTQKGSTEGPWPVYAVAYGNGLIYTSLDAEIWTPRNSGTNMPLHALTFGNNIFVAVGEKGAIVTGTRDGLKWTPVQSEITEDLRAIIYANKTFIAVGSEGTVITSPDGYNWKKNATLSPGQALTNIAYKRDEYFIDKGYFITISEDGTIFKSYDGVTWEDLKNKDVQRTYSLIYVNNLFVAVGTNGRIMTSPIGFGEGLSWFDRYSSTMEHLLGITYGNKKYVAVGANGTIMISTDLNTWSVVESGTKSTLAATAYGRGNFIVVAKDGTILRSTDAKAWSKTTKLK